MPLAWNVVAIFARLVPLISWQGMQEHLGLQRIQESRADQAKAEQILLGAGKAVGRGQHGPVSARELTTTGICPARRRRMGWRHGLNGNPFRLVSEIAALHCRSGPGNHKFPPRGVA